MRDYAKVAPQFWIGSTGKRIRQYGPQAQVVALYLLSSPHANMIGLYHLPIAYISADTGTPLEGASKALASLCEGGFCGYDVDAEVVWVFEMARFQIGEGLKAGDKQCRGVQNTYDGVPKNGFLPMFYDRYAAQFHLSERRGFEGSFKELRSQEQEQEIEQEQEQEQSPVLRTSSEQSSSAQISNVAASEELPERRQSRRRVEPSEDDLKCARYCFGLVLRILPDAKQPNYATWGRDVRLMVERDGKSHHNICELFKWANKNSFWNDKILSPSKLRDKWDQLNAQRQRDSAPRQSGGASIYDEVQANAAIAKEMLFGKKAAQPAEKDITPTPGGENA